MSFAHVSEKVMNQIMGFTTLAEERKIDWHLTIEDVIDVFDIAERIYSKAKGTCPEKVFIMVNALEWAFDVEESQIWKVLEIVVRWNPWIEELKEIYLNEFIRQDNLGLKERYDRINQRMKRKK